MTILIVGDSFAADWSIKCTQYVGWPNLLAEQFDVTNLARSGVSEYKIYKQLASVTVNQFDLIIVVHTSPYRIVTKRHPVHSEDCLHKDADLLFSDIEYHNNKFAWVKNRALRSAYEFFIWHFDKDYYDLTYKLIVGKIEQLITNTRTIVIVTPLVTLDAVNTTYISITNDMVCPGLINHMSKNNNQKLFEKITEIVNAIK